MSESAGRYWSEHRDRAEAHAAQLRSTSQVSWVEQSNDLHGWMVMVETNTQIATGDRALRLQLEAIADPALRAECLAAF